MDSNIRAAPTIESEIIAVVKKGTKLEKLGESGNWFNVRLASGKVGYIHKSLIRTSRNQTGFKKLNHL
jgi:uncharacterized protein YgiM (DUF1202 family)